MSKHEKKEEIVGLYKGTDLNVDDIVEDMQSYEFKRFDKQMKDSGFQFDFKADATTTDKELDALIWESTMKVAEAQTGKDWRGIIEPPEYEYDEDGWRIGSTRKADYEAYMENVRSGKISPIL